jgi:ribosomal-protein-alanine N-acetyltransferase
MTDDDLKGVYEVEKTAFPIPWSVNSFQEELKNMLATYLVAKIDGMVVGYIGAWFVIDECHITNIAVHKDFRNIGVASKLVKELLKLCYEHATTYITLEVRVSNTPAQNLYEKFGFNRETIRKGYYKNPDGTRENAIIMSKEM